MSVPSAGTRSASPTGRRHPGSASPWEAITISTVWPPGARLLLAQVLHKRAAPRDLAAAADGGCFTNQRHWCQATTAWRAAGNGRVRRAPEGLRGICAIDLSRRGHVLLALDHKQFPARHLCETTSVHPGRESRARWGACSAYESDSAGLLAERHETGDRQAPSRPHGLTVAAGVVPGFMPKAQLRADGRRRLDGLRRGALEIGDLRVGGGRSGTARARASARRLGSAGAGCPTRVGSVGGVRGRGRRGVPSRGVRSIRLSRRVRRLRT